MLLIALSLGQDMSTRTNDQTIQQEITSLKAMLSDQAFELHSEQEWQEVADHVRVHRFLINQAIPWTITWDDAVFSWYENVMRPIMDAVDTWNIRAAFPERSMGQLYLAVTTHWHFMKQANGSVTPEEAANDFAAQYGQGLAAWFSRHLTPRGTR